MAGPLSGHQRNAIRMPARIRFYRLTWGCTRWHNFPLKLVRISRVFIALVSRIKKAYHPPSFSASTNICRQKFGISMKGATRKTFRN